MPGVLQGPDHCAQRRLLVLQSPVMQLQEKEDTGELRCNPLNPSRGTPLDVVEGQNARQDWNQPLTVRGKEMG